MNTTQLQDRLCRSLCGDVRVQQRKDGLWRVDTPWTFPDGDAYCLYIELAPSGGLRISDQGLTMMRLSYENDIAKFREGTRGRLFSQVLADTGLLEDDGEFFLDSTAEDLGANVMRMGQALTRVHNLTFLNRLRVENTFYDDLREKLQSMVGTDRLISDYMIPNLPNASDYPVDYSVSGCATPLYLFGVPNRDKARLATIVLQHLAKHGLNFNSMIVFQNAADIPRTDMNRIMNAANDMIASIDSDDDLRRKLLKRVA